MLARRATRSATRQLAWVAGLAVLLAGTAACGRLAADPDAPIDRTVWAQRTGQLLSQALRIEDGQAVLIAPSHQGTDVYAMAQALVGLGDRAGRTLAAIEFDQDRERFDRGMAPEAVAAHIVGPIYLGGKVVRADEASAGALLTDQHKRTLRQVVDDALADRSTEWGIFELVNVRAISQAVDHRLEQVDQWLQQAGAGLSFDCGDPHDVPELGAASAAGLAVPCADRELVGLWDRAAGELSETLAARDVQAHGGDCEQLVGLARLQRSGWPADQARQDAVVGLFERFMELLANSQVTDLLSCLGGGLRTTAELLDLELALPGYAVQYATAVLRGGGEPWFVRLDQSGLATALRAARLVGAEVDLPLAQLRDTGAEQRLDLRLAAVGPAAAWSPELAGAVEQVAVATGPDDTLAVTALVRALTRGGSSACGSPALEVAGRFLADSASGLDGTPLAPRALAVRVVQGCGEDVSATASAIRRAAEAVLGRLGSDEPAELLAAADAVEALCALAPDALPDQQERWSAYAQLAAEFGGAADPAAGMISVSSTYALAVLAMTTTEDCADGTAEP